MLPSKATIIDLTERAGATFAQAFLAVIVVNQAQITQLTALETAGVAGAFAVAKFLLVKANTFLAPPAEAPALVTTVKAEPK